MKILTDYKDLVGKKIVFSHMAQFASEITIATEDGCILMATLDSDDFGDNKEVSIYPKYRVMNKIETDEWMRKELGELGVFDLDKYKEEQRIEAEKEKERRLIEREKREIAEYERLKSKFEG